MHNEHPHWEMHRIEEKAGVKNRFIAKSDETALDLAFEACKKLFADNNELDGVDTLIFCTQSQDYVMPPNSTILHKLLNLPDAVLAFDFNLACSGYIYGLAMAQSLLLSGMRKKVLLVTGDTYSKFINNRDRSARVLFGDGASASLIVADDSPEGILDIDCQTSGAGYDKFIIPAGGCRLPKSAETAIPYEDKSGNFRTQEEIHMNGMGILSFVTTKVPPHVKMILERNNLTIDDIDLFVFHQASKMALDSLGRLLDIPEEKLFRNIHEVGNVVSTSVPVALKHALDEGKIKKGDKVIACGFGVGLSWATTLLQF